MESSDLIVAEGLEKTYRNGVEVRAVRGIDLKIEKGEFTAIVGPSGSGKTTFLNLISGLDTPTAGRVFLDGREIGNMSGTELSDFRRDHIGFIFQAYNLIPVLTATENIEYVMILQGVEKQKRRNRVMELLEMVGLEDKADTRPTMLSGGQKQRVAVARAMAASPNIILADEPTANLDSTTSGELLDMMHQLNRDTGMTFIFSTHDPLVMQRAERLLTLRDGKITADETGSEKSIPGIDGKKEDEE